jgi:hypothetical protein
MMPLEFPGGDATIWSVTLESSITIVETSFDYRKMFIVLATAVIAFSVTSSFSTSEGFHNLKKMNAWYTCSLH